jgi:hypothetical protein
MSPAVARLSNDILVLIFECMLAVDVRKDIGRASSNRRLRHVLFVCRQWNVGPFPLLSHKSLHLMEIIFRP